jgi:hypothetical protein
MNTKNGSVLVPRMTIARPHSRRSKSRPSSGNLQCHNSTSLTAVMRINQNIENCNNSYSRTCTSSSSTPDKSHHFITSTSVSSLSRMNATSV